MRVVVIGAAFAGLAAADALQGRGHEIVVLEARDRVGGRVWSSRIAVSPECDVPVVIERGAEFVLDGYDELRRQVARFGLSLASTGMSYFVREPRGGAPVTVDELLAAGPSIAAAARTAPPGMSAQAVLEQMPLIDGVRGAVAARASISCAWPADDLDASALAGPATAMTAMASARVSGGNQLVAVRIAESLSSGVRLRELVGSISWRHDGVTVRTEHGEVEGDVAIVAVPLAVTGQIEFEARLPDWKRAALSAPALGQAAKLHVPLRRRPETSAVLAVHDRYWCWTATDRSGEVAPVLNCFAGSPPALKALEVDNGPASWLAAVCRLRPDLELDTDAVLLTTWEDDPFAQMAYSAARAGHEVDEAAMARPVGRLHFAGEHTAGACAGLMEGALRSGRRAASEVLGIDRD